MSEAVAETGVNWFDWLCAGVVGLALLGAAVHVWGGVQPDNPPPNEPPPVATRSGELVTRVENDQCAVSAWGSARAGTGGRFTVVLDSGNANSALLLTRADAETAGLDVGALRFTVPYRSVSGGGREARTSLHEFRVGGAVLRDVPAAVISESRGTNRSLVGLVLLKRLNFTVRRDACVLSW